MVGGMRIVSVVGIRSLLVVLSAVAMTSCGRKSAEPAKTADGRIAITVWAHHGKPEEWQTIQDQVRRFNDSQTKVSARLIEIAEANYDTQVQSAAASDALPDVLELDGPLLANYAWKGYLRPLDELDATIRADLLPSIVQQGTYTDKLYAVGTFDSGLGLFVNRRSLAAIGARIPESIDDAWSIEEFNTILGRLAEQEKKSGGDGAVLDVKRDYRGEWWTYGFYPILVSAGADLIDRAQFDHATGVVNSSAAVTALSHFQQWFESGLVDPNTDDRAFIEGRAAISWVGHWEFPRYRKAFGEDLLLLPLPDFGSGSRTASGSWAWGITRQSPNAAAAMAFIEFLLQPAEIAAIVMANGAVPARRSAIAQTPPYRVDGPLALYVEQLSKSSIPRPVTPAYPIITSAFQEAMAKIMQGADVRSTLDAAARIVDQDIRDNQGYPALPAEAQR